jgi:hypothetical protein
LDVQLLCTPAFYLLIPCLPFADDLFIPQFPFRFCFSFLFSFPWRWEIFFGFVCDAIQHPVVWR